ncbi:ABC transporter substrate-binding protein [Nitratireductor soli]|uniref:ABC transporter substrate-binding protein n=1 Tax=Nitratireductor soli TaxID=1670619 RepID=UPI00065E6C13|nr:ABC transporter substrate-binding protein [Nitratireductor soli]
MKKVLLTCCAALLLSLGNSYAKTLRLAYQGDLKSLDPYSVSETFALSMAGASYEGLVRRGENFAMEPALAESWEIIDPKHWRFHLRKGVTFHNGAPFTADDVLFSAERVRADGSDLKYRIPKEAEFIKIDDHTVDVMLPEANPILHYQWAGWYIMSKSWAEEHDAATPSPANADTPSYAALHENGTGPFMVESHQPGVKTVWKPFAAWWDKPKHNLDEVVLTTVSSDPTRVAALLSGQVDWIAPVPEQDIERINASGNAQVLQSPDLRTMYLGFDQVSDTLKYANVEGKNPFKDARVRRAVYQAIDIDGIIAKILRGAATPAALMIAPQLVNQTEEFKRFPYDPEMSKKLLAKAGYPDGFQVQLDCSNDRYPNDERVCQAVVGMLGRVGIKTTLNAQPKAKYFAKILSSGGYDTSFFMLGWSPAVLDSVDLFTNVLGCRDDKGNGGTMNVGGYCNPKIEELREQIRVETDKEKRDALIRQAWQISMVEDVAYAPLYQGGLAWGVAKNVHVKQRADGDIVFQTATID